MGLNGKEPESLAAKSGEFAKRAQCSRVADETSAVQEVRVIIQQGLKVFHVVPAADDHRVVAPLSFLEEPAKATGTAS